MSYLHNRRTRVYDARETAINLRETFVDRPWETETEFTWTWPAVLQNIGDSLGVAYGSDKWKKKKGGRRPVEIYKHIAESRNRIFCLPGAVRFDDVPGGRALGPRVDFSSVPMPQHFAVLGYFKECNVQLYTEVRDGSHAFGADEDDGVVTLSVKHGMLGASKIMWSETDGRADQPFLFVYSASEGVLFVIVGDELDVLKDGIVG